MFKKIYLIFVSLLGLSSALAQMPDGNKLVKPSLFLGTTDFSKPFIVGIKFKIEKDWHVYWKNSGDAGLPLSIKWNLPTGFKASELSFPVPHKTVDADIVAYGYSEEVILLTTITPSEIPPKGFEISGRADWLVCKEICVPGGAQVKLETSKLSDAELTFGKKIIEATKLKLPKPISLKQVKLEKISATGSGKNTLIEISFSGTDSKSITDFFPETIEGFSMDYIKVKVQDGKISMPMNPQNAQAHLSEIRGLIMFGDQGYEFVSPIKQDGQMNGGLLDQNFKSKSDESGISIIYALILAFIGGIILNIMPCVLPVLSLKVLSFVEQAGHDPKKIRAHGFYFTLGVLVSFWFLAMVVIILQKAGESVGWGFQFQSPAFVIVMTSVVFLFGLNLIGVFEIAAPVVSGNASASLSRNDILGSFANGILATTLATPCTAPFLGTALGFAFSQPAYVIFSIFTNVAIGLAAPYLILSLNPEWLKFVPKPGAWMNQFKQLMGFLLFGTVVWLLTVLGSQLGVEGVTAMIAFLLGLGLAAWMIGQFIDYSSSSSRKSLVWISAVAISILSYYFTFERWLDWRRVDSNAISSSSKINSEIDWKPFTIKTVEDQVNSGKSVFIDFTADWCFTCKVTEKTIIETDDVRNKIKQFGIVTIRADWTNRNDEITALLKKFGRSGVPLYVVFPAGNLNEPIVLPEVITKELLIEAFEKASTKTSAMK